MASVSVINATLEKWVKAGQPKTVGEFIQAFPDHGHAVVIFLLMLLPATPLPTGGLTHVFEVISVLMALQIIRNSKSLWLPQRLKKITFSAQTLKRLNETVTKINQLESKLGFRSTTLSSQWFKRFIGVVLLLFILAALVAPPFSGIDTLPALGAVMLSLGLITESLLVIILGLLAGFGGIVLEITVGKFVYSKLF